MLDKIPHGYEEIVKTFGDPRQPGFEREHIVSFALPYPLLYDGHQVTHARCHSLAVGRFQEALQAIKDRGLESEVQNYGGIYAVRPKRGSTKLSTHAWGIAIDLEPLKYPLGSIKRFPDIIVQIFQDCGFVYGGDFFRRKDPMHFQLCSGF